MHTCMIHADRHTRHTRHTGHTCKEPTHAMGEYLRIVEKRNKNDVNARWIFFWKKVSALKRFEKIEEISYVNNVVHLKPKPMWTIWFNPLPWLTRACAIWSQLKKGIAPVGDVTIKSDHAFDDPSLTIENRCVDFWLLFSPDTLN